MESAENILANVDFNNTDKSVDSLLLAAAYVGKLKEDKNGYLKALEYRLYESLALVGGRLGLTEIDVFLTRISNVIFSSKLSISYLSSLDGIHELNKIISKDNDFISFLTDVETIYSLNYNTELVEFVDSIKVKRALNSYSLNDVDYNVYKETLLNNPYLVILLLAKFTFKQNFKYCVKSIIVESSVLDE